MDWFPLFNSLRVSALSAAIVFFPGVAAAYYIARLPRASRRALDVLFTLPLVLPPTVVGYLLLCVFGPRRVVGAWALERFAVELTGQWWSAVPAVSLIIFPLMYRMARGAFERFDETLSDAGRTLGLSGAWIFWHVRMPACRQGILAGAALSFARALGEYGATSMLAGHVPGSTATIATGVYELWRVGDDALALRWVLVSIALSAAALLAVNLLEKREGRR